MNYIKLFLAVAAITISALSYSGFFAGKIIKLELGPNYGDNVLVDVEGSQNNPAACSTNSIYDFAFDGSTEYGKKLFSVLLAAQLAGTKIEISGYGSCQHYSNIEDLRWLRSS